MGNAKKSYEDVYELKIEKRKDLKSINKKVGKKGINLCMNKNNDLRYYYVFRDYCNNFSLES